MQSTMMHMPMTVQMILAHGRDVFPESQVGTFDGESMAYTSYRQIADSAGQLAAALHAIGVKPGNRVATFSWNNTAHMEAYLGVPSMGAIIHTVNIRLSPEHIAYIINHAEDKVVLLDASLIELFAPVLPLLQSVEHILLIGEGELQTDILTLDYRAHLAEHAPCETWPELDETAAAAVCYTSGTTGNPKGVVYSHRTTFVHSLASRATDTFGICERDRILLLPAMFHANAWGLPYSGWLSGSDFTLPGPHLQPEGIKRMIALDRPTFTATVPTILGDLLHADAQDLDMSCFRMLVCGGSAVPPAMIDAARDRWGVPVLQGWGMTETSPLCALSHPPRDAHGAGETVWRAKSGRPVPGVQVRVVGEDGSVLPHDGESVGELQLRGPWITGGYHRGESQDSQTEDGWLRTGDVGHIDTRHYVQLTDRTKDVIKSGGEWISSVDLENILAGHPDVREVAVIATPDERWQERPLVIVVGDRPEVDLGELREFLRDKVARFWLPEFWAFVDEIPKTSVGKMDKKRLRQMNEAGELSIEEVQR
ncbi:fatty-acid--CoA ligase [Seongchinamella unica]|uniref:Fatty-acid--CoA ligase n=1 Tax=Seongchinamella unica TaxID=2547392 RepID=A0A4R5LV91_9GAMM|nr:long-chain fatty acid--CoA ligase [Seongchinamella unica]TDG15343.1 fatty-acid--CoA ligase [Seongchinamella unica]